MVKFQYKVLLKGLFLIGYLFGLCACSQNNEDILQWMNERKQHMVVKTESLPPLKKFSSYEFTATNESSPFSLSRVQSKSVLQSKNSPDPNRAKEPLEKFPLEQLSMVGVITQDHQKVALIKADNLLYQVRVGQYVGLNDGKVIQIEDGQIHILEYVENLEGQWLKEPKSLFLDEMTK